jgi:WD40 repeat protein
LALRFATVCCAKHHRGRRAVFMPRSPSHPESRELRFFQKVQDVDTGDLIHLFEKLGKKAGPVAFSHDKRFYLTQENAPWDGSLTLWDLLTKKVVKVLERKKDHRTLLRVTFATDGKLVAIAGADLLLQVWDVEAGRMVANLTIPDEILQNPPRKKKEGR